MAFAFGDSTVKLPPIRKESVEETRGSGDPGSKLAASSVPHLHRKKHGLVRLPPIVRLDSPKSDTSSSPIDEGDWRTDSHTPYSLNPDTCPVGHRKFEETSDLSLPSARLSSRTVKDGDIGDQYHEGQQFRPNVNDVYTTTDVVGNGKRGILVAGEISTELTPPCSLRRPSPSTVQDFPSFSTTRQLQGSAFGEKPLRRARPYAKSSPELSERRQRAQQNPKIISTTDSRLGEAVARRPSVFDVNATLLLKSEEKNVGRQAPLLTKPSKQHVPKVEGTARQRTERRNKDLALTTKAHSNPASPVCNERPTSSKVHGRKSLTDIQGLLPFNNRRPSLVQHVKSQNLMKDDSAELTVKGKTCPRSERRPSRTFDSKNDHLIPPPNVTAKRDSLYDLRQILGILNQEGADQSSTSVSPNNASAPPGDGAGNMGASVYDLREFLSLALQTDAFQDNTEKSSEKSSEKGSETQPQAEENSNSLLNAGTTSRRVSAYDLMEFLTLGKSPSQSSSRTSTPPAASSPGGQQGSKLGNLEVPGDDSSTRRSSTYDLMEFLSLRLHSSPHPHTPLQGKQKLPLAAPVEASGQELLQESRKERSLSMYDLKEFLAMQSVAQPTTRPENRKTISPRQSKENLTVPGTENAGTLAEEGQVTEGQRHETRQVSVYDLREFLKLYSLTRKPSSISESGVSIYVTDEAENEEDPSLPISEQNSVEAAQSRKASTYDLTEFLNALETDNSPLRRRMSSISGTSEEHHEYRPSISSRTDSGGFLCVNSYASRPSFSDASRQDSIGNRSLYDLHEFLTLLNSEDVLTGRRLSNMTERAKVLSPTSTSRQDEKFVYEHPAAKNDVNINSTETESQRPGDKDERGLLKEDISIEVPKFLPKASEKTAIPDRFSIKNRLAALKSVPETTDN